MPSAKVGLPGETTSDVTLALLTVRVIWPETLPTAAEIWLCPAATPEATPVLETTVAAEVLLEVQLAEVVTSWVKPLLSVAVAIKS